MMRGVSAIKVHSAASLQRAQQRLSHHLASPSVHCALPSQKFRGNERTNDPKTTFDEPVKKQNT